MKNSTEVSASDPDKALRRKAFNLLVSGHTYNRLQHKADTVLAALLSALDAVRNSNMLSERTLCIWTGLCEGTDEATATWAEKVDVVLYRVAVTPAGIKNSNDMRSPSDLIAIAAQGSPDGRYPLWAHQASDEFKLAMADVVIAVWDGCAPRGSTGGVVRLVAEALRRRVPVLWIDLDGQYLLSAPFDPEICSQVRLDLIDALVPTTLTPLFSAPEPIKKILGRLADLVTWQLQHDLTPVDDPGDRVVLAGFWHSALFTLVGWKLHRRGKLFTLVGSWKLHRRGKVDADRGPEGFATSSLLGGWFWGQIFDPFDRAATHAANRYRDGVVLSHLLSSAAVLGAVAGAIAWLGINDAVWAFVELFALLAVGLLVRRANPSRKKTGKRPLRDLWLQTRQAAEALRVSALLFPFLASLPELHRGLWSMERSTDGKEHVVLASRPRWVALQALREADPPIGLGNVNLEPGGERYLLANHLGPLRTHLETFLDGQIDYHLKNAEKCETTHHRLHCITQSVYFIALGVVIVHVGMLAVEWIWNGQHNLLISLAQVFAEQRWLLLVTAFFPALAAALHGILSTMELQRIAATSMRVHEQLKQIKESLGRQQNTPMELRAHAMLTAQVVFAEHASWSDLMTEQNLGIPA